MASFLEMSLGGCCIILTAALLRTAAKDRLPVGMFEALWALACLRLTVPVRLPFRLSAFALLRRAVPRAAGAVTVPAAVAQMVPAAPHGVDIIQMVPQAESGTPFPTATVLWLAGAAVCAGLLAVSYARTCRRFRGAAPAQCSYVNQFLAEHPLRRRVSVRVSERADAPLTYGIARPVILLPRSMDGADGETMGYVLAHELAHIRRFDALRKLALAAVACLHWFDPAVWLMVLLAGRDMERSCDRAVVRSLDGSGRRAYAQALLDMEARRAGFSPGSGFAKNAIEERIHSIMKIRPRSFFSSLLALALVLAVGTAFATAAPGPETEDGPAPDTSSGDATVSGDGTSVYVFTADGEPVSLDQQEYKLVYDPAEAGDVEWWTAEEYAAWLEQEKEDLQDCLGQRAWTNSDGWFTWTQEKIDETIAMYEQVLAEIENGLLVSKTADGSSDALLIQGSQDTVFFVEDPAAGTDSGWSADDLYRGYSYTIADVHGSVTLGSYDTPEELLAALKDEVDARVADGRMTEDEAQGILDHFDPAPGAEQVFTSGGEITYSFNGSAGMTADQQLYATMVTPTDELLSSLQALDDAIEPYLPFGLRSSYDVPTGELTLIWNGQQVRGLYDGTAGVWITGHSGDSAWPEGTPELVAVYQDGKLTGLRLATEEEQAQWDRLRAEAGVYAAPDRSAPSPEDEAEDALPVPVDNGTVSVPSDEDAVEFFLQAEGPYGEIAPGRRVKLAGGVTVAAGNEIAVGLTARTDAALTVSLQGGAGMDESVQLKAGETRTVTFSPEQAGTYGIYLTNDSEYSVEFTASWVVS